MAIVYKKREVTQKYTVIKLIKRYTLNRENSVQTVCKRQSDPEQNQGHLPMTIVCRLFSRALKTLFILHIQILWW